MDLKEIIIIVGIGFVFMKIYQFIKNNKDRWKNKNPFKWFYKNFKIFEKFVQKGFFRGYINGRTSIV